METMNHHHRAPVPWDPRQSSRWRSWDHGLIEQRRHYPAACWQLPPLHGTSRDLKVPTFMGLHRQDTRHQKLTARLPRLRHRPGARAAGGNAGGHNLSAAGTRTRPTYGVSGTWRRHCQHWRRCRPGTTRLSTSSKPPEFTSRTPASPAAHGQPCTRPPPPGPRHPSPSGAALRARRQATARSTSARTSPPS